ncbi:MAG TPA: rod shape-determining protein [Candidatus Eremiobacteraeota bacterium]|nr:MAG: Rod shape-determining protein MreB [bacterium ADurb.Bin363]HPZ08571.1 rod shape-determining protein [Candidatus Eremiobacteraeota bacterium]
MRIGIDIGTSHVAVAIEKRGILFREPSVLAISKKNNKVMCVGENAKEMLGKTNPDIGAIYPLKEGVIADYQATEFMLKYFLNKVCGKIKLVKPFVILSVPVKLTSIEERALEEAALAAGAQKVHLIPSPLAAALGAELSIHKPAGHMVVDIGAGTTDIAVISLGDIVCSESLRSGGNKMDEAIKRYVRKIYNLIIGDQAAEEIKIKISSAVPMDTSMSMEVKGRDLIDSLPKSITLTDEEIKEPVEESLKVILEGIKKVFEKTPPELISDIIDNGVLLTGGGGLLRGLDERLTRDIGVCFYIPEDSINCVAKGTVLARI